MLCVRALLLAVAVVRGWVARVVGVVPSLVCWVLGWCRCLWRVLWLSAAVAVARCSALRCCALCCAALPLYAHVPLVCAALHCSVVRLSHQGELHAILIAQISFARLCRLCVPGCCAVMRCSGVCCAALFPH